MLLNIDTAFALRSYVSLRNLVHQLDVCQNPTRTRNSVTIYIQVYVFMLILVLLHLFCNYWLNNISYVVWRCIRIYPHIKTKHNQAVPWLRRLAAGLPPRRPGSVHVGFVVDKVALGQGFPQVLRFSPFGFYSTGAPLLGKGQKIIIIVIFITGLHKKPQGCGASVASTAGPFTTKHNQQIWYLTSPLAYVWILQKRIKSQQTLSLYLEISSNRLLEISK
jgi:hypothetical protein